MLRTLSQVPYLLTMTAVVTAANSTISPNCRQAVCLHPSISKSRLTLQCAQLSSTFGPALHYPGTDNFTIWDAKQQEVIPACRIEPSTALDVSQTLNILVENWCYFSVKGGGHSRHAGDSNSVGGVTIDLDRLTNVEVLGNGTTARVGGGATTVQVYQALQEQGLSFVGGRVASVGLGRIGRG